MSRYGASTMPRGIGMFRLAHPDSSCRVSAAVVATVSAVSESGRMALAYARACSVGPSRRDTRTTAWTRDGIEMPPGHGASSSPT